MSNKAPIPQLPRPNKAVNAANAIAYAVEIGTGIATAIAGVRDDRMRANFRQNLQLLSNEQQLALAKALNSANNQEERLRILGLALTDMSKQRINNIQQVIAQQEKNKRNKLLVTSLLIVGVLGVVGVIAYLYNKKQP
jgi:hypothetical protein